MRVSESTQTWMMLAGVAAALLLSGCKDAGCKTDNDCKGDRVCDNGSCVDAHQSPPPTPLSTKAPTSPPNSPSVNSGDDARKPVLDPADDGFVDSRGGWGWSDRCWKNLKKGKFGWAKAECDSAMAMNPQSPSPRSSILYNLGLIEQGSKNPAGARKYFEESLALREHPEVRAALEALQGRGSSSLPRKQISCGGQTCDVVCCASFGKLACATDPSNCERATNGEGTLLMCDGPEDCGAGNVCCMDPSDRTFGAFCVDRGKCTGVYHHPRYDNDMPRQIVCHTAADCPTGKACVAETPLPVCK